MFFVSSLAAVWSCCGPRVIGASPTQKSGVPEEWNDVILTYFHARRRLPADPHVRDDKDEIEMRLLGAFALGVLLAAFGA